MFQEKENLLIVGSTGSGKTARAVNEINKHFGCDCTVLVFDMKKTSTWSDIENKSKLNKRLSNSTDLEFMINKIHDQIEQRLRTPLSENNSMVLVIEDFSFAKSILDLNKTFDDPNKPFSSFFNLYSKLGKVIHSPKDLGLYVIITTESKEIIPEVYKSKMNIIELSQKIGK